jgi:uncharacterized SAM-binding protein YcdF (DUF218 family)
MGLVAQLARLTHPAAQTALLLILGLCFARLRRYRLAGGLLGAAVFWLWLCCTPAFASWLQQGLAHPYPLMEASAYPRVDAIVVLGGGKLPRSGIDWSTDDPDTQATRLGFGLQLFQNARAGTILLSGSDQSQKMALKLEEQGVPASALETEDTSENTHQNALYSAAMLKHENLQRILLVTSGIHMPRAMASFARQGLIVIPAPALDPGLQMSHPWWPERAALTLTARCLREHLGMWGYRLRGWV